MLVNPPFVELSRKVTIADGETAGGIDFELIRGGAITGRITNVDGRPVKESVYLFDVEPALKQIAERVTYTGLHSPTDDRGIYRISGVPPGRYKASVGDSDGHFNPWFLEPRYRQVFSPA
jgi:hypothetical protein